MKVLFLLNGLTHYFNSVLNKINNSDSIDLTLVVPGKDNSDIGKNVYLTDEGIDYKIYYLKEKKRYYGKVFVKEFRKVLLKVNPDVVVFIWPYILELVFNPLLMYHLKKNNIKIIFKEIPFQVQSFSDALQFKSTEFIDENMKTSSNNIITKINNFLTALVRRYYYSIIDLNLHYIDHGYDVLKSYGVNTEKIFVTYNSPDTDKLLQAKQEILDDDFIRPINKYRLIHVGRLVKWKRVELIIEAVAVLSKEFEEIELLVIGNGPELQNLKELSIQLNIEKKVVFLGAVYDPKLLGKYFKCSSIYVLGGMGGLSLNEAMTFGKPIICSVCDGTEKTLVQDGYNGYYFHNGDLESLIKKIKILFSNPERIEKFGRNSLKVIEQKINLNKVANKYIEAFNYLMKK